MKTFIETYISKEDEVKALCLKTLHEEYPGVKFSLKTISCHEPLMETDAGFSLTYDGTDKNRYTAYCWEEHPLNFRHNRHGQCIVQRFIRSDSCKYL